MLKPLLLGLLMLGTQLQSMIDINGEGINKQALFFGACKQGNIKLVEKLINAGVDLNALNSFGKTGLTCAIENGQNDVAEMLIQAGSIADNMSFKIAVTLFDAKLVKKLIDAGADINASIFELGNGCGTALKLCCSYCVFDGAHPIVGHDLYTDILQVLLDNGADINFIDGETLNHLIVQPNCEEKLKLLMAAGVNINQSYNGCSILMHACIYRLKRTGYPNINIDTIISLINAGADINSKDYYGRSIFDVACENCDFELIDFLQRYLKEQEAKKSSITIQNNTDNSLNVSHAAEVPAHSKAVIRTEISKI
jgi:ankyrin repeat protein